MLFTAPYLSDDKRSSSSSCPSFSRQRAVDFHLSHGLGVCAVAIEVDDVASSFETLVANGGRPVCSPTVCVDEAGRGQAHWAEVELYGDVVLRLVNVDAFRGSFLPNYEDIKPAVSSLQNTKDKNRYLGKFGLFRFDHIVGNLWSLQPRMQELMQQTGFHEFAEFVADDVGTVDSGLNSIVLANNNEMILLPLNEVTHYFKLRNNLSEQPTFGTKRKSQIQTYLEQNAGPGVQHMALFSTDIFSTLNKMREANGGFDFLEPPHKDYYKNVRRRLGDALSEEIYR